MEFCPQCNFLFDINKSSTDDKILLSKVNDVFVELEKKSNLLNYKVNFSKDDIIKHKKYNTLSDNDKKNINLLFNNISISAEFKCNNCNYVKPINQTILLYQINNQDINNNDNKSLNINKYIINNPLLPHTHNYTCKNINCKTHKDNKLKDSVFYHDDKTYKLIYVCCVCYHTWNNL